MIAEKIICGTARLIKQSKFGRNERILQKVFGRQLENTFVVQLSMVQAQLETTASFIRYNIRENGSFFSIIDCNYCEIVLFFIVANTFEES